MRRAFVMVLVFAALGTDPALAGPTQAGPARAEGGFAEGGFALGLIAGNPAGITAAYDFWRPPNGEDTVGKAAAGPAAALQGSLAWDLTSPGGIVATGDWLFIFDRYFRIGDSPVPLYAGIGGQATLLAGSGRYGTSDADFGLSVRLPLGLRWNFGEPPLEAFAEFVPGLLLYPGVKWEPGAGLGLRWRFRPK